MKLILPKGVSVTEKHLSHVINFIAETNKLKQLKYLKANSSNLVNLKKFSFGSFFFFLFSKRLLQIDLY